MNSTSTNVSYVVQPWESQAALPRAASPVELRGLQRKLVEAANGCDARDEMLAAVANVVSELLAPESLLHFARADDGELDDVTVLISSDSKDEPKWETAVRESCRAACQHGHLHIKPLDAVGGRVALALPVFRRGELPEALAFIFPEAVSHSAEVQLVAVAVTLWHVLKSSRDSQADADDSAAVLELLSKISAADDSRHAALVLTNELAEYLELQQVAVGFCDRENSCRLAAVSGAAQFDKHSELTACFEAAMNEALLNDRTVIWPPNDLHDRDSTLAHQKLASKTGAATVVSHIVHGEEGDPVGVCVALHDVLLDSTSPQLQFLAAVAPRVGVSLKLVQRAQRGPVTRAIQKLARNRHTWQVRVMFAAACGLMALMALPLPYHVHCDCELQPVTRRFVAAPFDGRLDTSLVAPGDIVKQGDLLARLDGREIRWELAGLTAEFEQAKKQRDVAMATGKVAEAQGAKLEIQRLDLKIRLLNHRSENLEIRSPLAGVVVTGDLEKAEGAPLELGQTLFEIAPLDRMVVEVAIPESDIAYVHAGEKVTARLDAFPSRRWTAKLEKIHPRSEIREQQSVFVAEFALDNAGEQLRPGMKGRAKVTGPRRPLGWNLFHKAWESAAMAIGW